MNKRPEWIDYFMQIATLVSSRASCIRRKVGAVIVKDKQILATGYNGVPSGIHHCSDSECIRNVQKIPSGQRHELCRGLHAEQNALIQAAVHGVSIADSELYCTTQPCIVCSKMIINARIRRVYFEGVYPDTLATDMLKEAGIDLIHYITFKSYSSHC